jgi:hypothetical protein
MCEHKYDCGCEKEICEDCREIIAEDNIPEEPEAPAEEEDAEMRCDCCGETEEENEDILEIITCAGCDNNYCDICEEYETFLEDWGEDGMVLNLKYWCVACYNVEEKRREEKNI